jgi:hypothetical protein
MNISNLSTNILAHTAIIALKNAYDECTEKTAKESIVTAFKAIIQLQQGLRKESVQDSAVENDSEYDPSEFCAAV